MEGQRRRGEERRMVGQKKRVGGRIRDRSDHKM